VPHPHLEDDLDFAPLINSVKQEIAQFGAGVKTDLLRFGPETISKEAYVKALMRFVEILSSAQSKADALKQISQEFRFLAVYGEKRWGDVFITSYFEPVLSASYKKTAQFSEPLYRTPPDLVALDLSKFSEKFKAERKLRGRVSGKEFRPYFTREDITTRNVLSGRHLEIAYLDPIDAFFLQVQGSGRLSFESGQSLTLNFSDKNGWPYEAIGKFVKDKIAPEKVTLQTLERYLRRLDSNSMRKLLNLNPSYVFFEASTTPARTALGISATAGRTIATDPKFFPKGALGFMKFERPQFDQAGRVNFIPTSRFVLSEDVGGAITGPARVDLFWGSGDEAKRYAGEMQGRGTLYFLLPRRD